MTPTLLKHRNNTDVAIEVKKIRIIKETGVLKLTVIWWNIGLCHAPFSMNLEQKIQIKIEDWPKWEHYFWRGKS